MNKPQITTADLEKAIRNIPDFPKPGIQFKDITPVLADARLFAGAIELLTANYKPGSVDAVVGIETQGAVHGVKPLFLRKSAGFRATLSDYPANRSRNLWHGR